VNTQNDKSHLSFDNGHRWNELKFNGTNDFNLVDVFASESYPGFFVANGKQNKTLFLESI
jgi:hypothetical protein